MWDVKKNRRSYFNWGLRELQKRIDSQCEVGYTEFEVINLFIHEMKDYSCENSVASHIFSAALDAGYYALDNYISTEKKKGDKLNGVKKRGNCFIGWG